VTVMVNGAPEGQPFYYQGSVNFHFVSIQGCCSDLQLGHVATLD
jgi:hypothetical protein